MRPLRAASADAGTASITIATTTPSPLRTPPIIGVEPRRAAMSSRLARRFEHLADGRELDPRPALRLARGDLGGVDVLPARPRDVVRGLFGEQRVDRLARHV